MRCWFHCYISTGRGDRADQAHVENTCTQGSYMRPATAIGDSKNGQMERVKIPSN